MLLKGQCEILRYADVASHAELRHLRCGVHPSLSWLGFLLTALGSFQGRVVCVLRTELFWQTTIMLTNNSQTTDYL